jgi:hypothetical protein
MYRTVKAVHVLTYANSPLDSSVVLVRTHVVRVIYVGIRLTIQVLTGQ